MCEIEPRIAVWGRVDSVWGVAHLAHKDTSKHWPPAWPSRSGLHGAQEAVRCAGIVVRVAAGATSASDSEALNLHKKLVSRKFLLLLFCLSFLGLEASDRVSAQTEPSGPASCKFECFCCLLCYTPTRLFATETLSQLHRDAASVQQRHRVCATETLSL